MDKRILFVDDEISILRAIRRAFFNSNFTIFIGNSAHEGLEILKDNEVDIVVSDVKMPEMDGITFLTEVKRLYPNIDRIILSGFVERDSVLRAIVSGVAFDYITKPWDNDVLFDKLEYILLMRERLSNRGLVTFLNSIETLPKTGDTFEKFFKAVEENRSIRELTELAEKDVAISTKVLQLVNSAFYAKTKVGSIEQALEIIGVSGIKHILLFSTLKEKTTIDDKQLEELQKFNDLINKTCKLFVRIYEVEKGEKPPQEYYMLGMVTYIGKIILLSYFSEKYFEIKTKLAENRDMTFWEAQLSLEFGDCTHVEIGAYFLSLWNFPLIYFQVILNYMTPYTAPEEIRDVIYILNLAKKYAEYSSDTVIEEILTTKEHNNEIKEYLYEYKK